MNNELIARISKLGFNVLCAATHTPQDIPKKEIFVKNVELIKKSDIFVAVLKDYGKDLAAEVGMAYAYNKPTIGIDYDAKDSDVMIYYAFDKIIKPTDLEKTLSPLLK
jgi:nucleoside 2-deoxyribosyltransferase